MKCMLGSLKGSVLRVFLVMLLTLLPACSYKDRVAPLNLPESAENMVVVGDGLKVAALAFVDGKEAADAFGFDIRKAGLLPIQITFQNDGNSSVKVIPEQTFLIDRQQQAWPVATLERTYQRTKGFVDLGETAKSAAKPSLLLGAAGAVAGFAIGIVTGENIGEAMGKGAVLGAAAGTMIGGVKGYQETGAKIREDLASKSLQNTLIIPGQIAYGVLFFPGKDAEAQSVRELRLSLKVGAESQIVRIHF